MNDGSPLMTEWIEQDAVEFDVDSDQIIIELANENRKMLELLRIHGLEGELLNRLEGIAAKEPK